jgi:hypothetical protein
MAEQMRENAIMLRLRPVGEADVVEQAARLDGKAPSVWCREIVVAAARRRAGRVVRRNVTAAAAAFALVAAEDGQ